MKKEPRFQYKSLEDPEYIKDRDDFFKEAGNGWWITFGLDKKRRPRLTKK